MEGRVGRRGDSVLLRAAACCCCVGAVCSLRDSVKEPFSQRAVA